MKPLKTVVLMKVVLSILVVFCSCGGGNSDGPPDPCIDALAALESDMRNDLDAVVTDTDFTFTVKSDHGDVFSHSTGESSGAVMYESASTSKMVTATVILSLVQEGVLSLEDHPQDYISFWPATGNLSLIRLEHLLSFTSGLSNEPACINLPSYDFDLCVSNIIDRNGTTKTPGEEFYYASTHLQVAGLMAIEASGQASWQDVMDQFKSKTGLFADSIYDLPSLENPRLAGGMHWSADEYMAFLDALYHEQILDGEMLHQMTIDQIVGATIGNSPAMDAIGEDWHYGYGNWIECHITPNDCTQTTRISSPGAYGAYPFIDFENGYFGILAREGALRSFDEGYHVFESVASKLETWASLSCN